MHRHSGQMIFECLYQMVVTLAFLVKLLNQLWYRDKVSVRSINLLFNYYSYEIHKHTDLIIFACSFSTISFSVCTKSWNIIGMYLQTTWKLVF